MKKLLDNRPVPSVYLGLSATSEQIKNSGLIRQLYEKCAADIRADERTDGRPRMIWFTTATPSAYLGGSLFWKIDPQQDASFAAASKRVADAICCQRKFRREEYPFALFGAAGEVRYSKRERARVAAISDKVGFTLFCRIGIDEANGDRLLVVARSRAEENSGTGKVSSQMAITPP